MKSNSITQTKTSKLNTKKILGYIFLVIFILLGLFIGLSLNKNEDIAPSESEASQSAVHLPIEAEGLLPMPPAYLITNSNGKVKLGVARKFGGAVTYYADNRLPGTAHGGNIIDYYQGGALLSHAIWTFPRTLDERELCYVGQQKVQKVPEWTETDLDCIDGNKDGDDVCYCRHTLPNNNPTQGGTTSNGWFGNMNGRNNENTVILEDNKFKIESRLVNFNFAYNQNQKGNDPRSSEFLDSNSSEWQTDMWIDQEIYFHEELEDVVVLDTTVTYCKDNNSNCSNKPILFADNQISTLFALGNGSGDGYGDEAYRGPYTKIAYKNSSGVKVFGGSESPFPGSHLSDFSENWLAVVQTNKKDGEYIGAGFALNDYVPRPPEGTQEFGYAINDYPVISAIQPDLSKFANSGIDVLEVGDRLDENLLDTYDKSLLKIFDYDVAGESVIEKSEVYRALPGGWFKYKVFLTTGKISTIRTNLLEAQELEQRPTAIGTATATGTLTSTSTITPSIETKPEDLDKNGSVGINDFRLFVTDYKTGNKRIDFNKNGIYKEDIGDFVVFAETYKKENIK